MNDLESKLRSLAFKAPPPAVRGVCLTPVASRWSTPPKAAWLGIAALWLGLLLGDRLVDAGPRREHAAALADVTETATAPPVALASSDSSTVLAFRIRLAAGDAPFTF